MVYRIVKALIKYRVVTFYSSLFTITVDKNVVRFILHRKARAVIKAIELRHANIAICNMTSQLHSRSIKRNTAQLIVQWRSQNFHLEGAVSPPLSSLFPIR